MPLTYLTFLIIQLNHLVDYGLHTDVSMHEVKEHIGRGNVLAWLEERFAGHVDVSIYRANPEATAAFSEKLLALLQGCDGDERRKADVSDNGICLLIAWVNELIQRRRDGPALWQPRTARADSNLARGGDLQMLSPKDSAA